MIGDAASRTALPPGTRVGPYEVLELLGAGGMGEVYRARDPRLNRQVAIKILPERLGHSEDRLDRFEREARAAGALNHPNVLTVFDVGSHGGIPYLVTELLQGETLRSAMRVQPPECVRPSPGCSRPPTASRPRTTPASCTATSSPRTSSSPGTVG